MQAGDNAPLVITKSLQPTLASQVAAFWSMSKTGANCQPCSATQHKLCTLYSFLSCHCDCTDVCYADDDSDAAHTCCNPLLITAGGMLPLCVIV